MAVKRKVEDKIDKYIHSSYITHLFGKYIYKLYGQIELHSVIFVRHVFTMDFDL